MNLSNGEKYSFVHEKMAALKAAILKELLN